jgi:L-threonylcarbamoyladenylate synthase
VRTRVLPAFDDDQLWVAVHAAVEVWQQRGIVAMPTETVYGLAGLADDDAALAAIFAAKGRPADNPLIVHVASLEQARLLWLPTERSAARATALASACWPGPLTIVDVAGAGVSMIVRAGLPKVAVRVPAHPVALALLQQLQRPLAAPSANLSGRPSPTTAAHVMATLSDRIPLVIDGGPCRRGLESTVVDVAGDVPRVLRLGALSLAAVQAVLPDAVIAEQDDKAASPGLRHRHYAPAVPVRRFVARASLSSWWGRDDVALLVRDSTASWLTQQHGLSSMMFVLPDDPQRCGVQLYALLYAIEARTPAMLIVEELEDSPAWAAINDRLRRALE